MSKVDWHWAAAGAGVAAWALMVAWFLFGCGGAEFTYDPGATAFENPGFQTPNPAQIPPDSGKPAPAQVTATVLPAATGQDAGAQAQPGGQDAAQPEAGAEAGESGQAGSWKIPLPITPEAGPAVDAAAVLVHCTAASCQVSTDCQSWCPQPEQGYQFCCTASASSPGRCYMSSMACP